MVIFKVKEALNLILVINEAQFDKIVVYSISGSTLEFKNEINFEQTI